MWLRISAKILISIGPLVQKGYISKLKHKLWGFLDCMYKLILKAPFSKQITFKISINVIEDQCLASETDDENWIWHQRFEHAEWGGNGARITTHQAI